MSASTHRPQSPVSGQPQSGAKRWLPVVKGLLVYCSSVSISVAAAAALVTGVPAEFLLGSF
ncbi:MAG: hypothetical protein Q8K71_06480 [Polaromonas sp.]|nr:hypothetical protein [Polaromonas sp.]MDP3753670.1 hypothetical protein [Polaromonas sp.]